ncbi:MAG: hypothetical protein K9L56_14610 [Clostridiales bacterium]|nr:hypothetical protein [Clostridiales bacterium]
MFTIKYEPDTNHDPIDEFEVTIEDGKTVDEMLEIFVRTLLAMGYMEGSLTGKVNTEVYPFFNSNY